MYLYRRGNTIRIAFHSDDDQLLVGTLPLKAALAPFRADALQALTDAVRADPLLTEAVSRPPTEPVRGFAGDRYFFRRAVGPGWVLLGDAGHHKDFLSGDGMSEALLSARGAAAAILAALGASTQRDASHALERFWRQRDVEALPLFHHARDLAEPDVGGRLDGAVFDELNAGPESARQRFAGIFTRETSPYESVPAALALRVAASRMLRGDLRVFGECVRRARRARQVAQEQQRCRALLDALPASLTPPHAKKGPLRSRAEAES
jgi:flavin-dependent dehydrogenase